ncbi:MAG: amidohydrolase family protein [Acidobacteriota bacterium]|nr:amidohydrolase family protein [Blastocatellia bacterium]MDW8240968.1 amidohydrolase family protein [Acidobacteriota bacterium]
MIVDCHSHVWLREHLSDEFIADSSRAKTSPVNFDIRPEDHWTAMGPVDKAIVFGLRAKHSGILVPNEFVAAYVREHPEKLIGFASVDPSEPGYLDILQHSVEELNLRGVKLGPIYQNVHPMDKRMQPIYEYCQRKHLPLMIHQGTTFLRVAPLKIASPVLLEDVALEYPDLKIVIAHLGHPWIEETTVLIRKQPNIFADISALCYRPWQFYNALVLANEYCVLDKLLFGSDFPFATPQETIDGLLSINRLVEGTSLPRVPEEALQGIVQRDALTILGIEG